MQAAQIEALRSRIAVLGKQQRAVLRRELERRGIDWARVAPDEAVERPARLPLTPTQLHFWIQQQLKPESSAFLISFSWRFHGPLDRDALRRSLQHLVDRHEPLRTAFAVDEGGSWQNVESECSLVLGFTDLSSAPGELDARSCEVAAAAFDLARAPLLRAHLFKLADQHHTLVISMHHIVADGWSRGVFMRELAACYQAFSQGRAVALAPLKRRFGDMVLDQHAWLSGAEYERQKAYWTCRLSGLETLELPMDRPRGNGHALSMASATTMRALPGPLSARVSELAGELKATPFMVLLAAFKLLLHRYSGQSDFAVSVPVAGRKDADDAGIIGLFTNTVLLRADVDPTLSFRCWLDRVRVTLAEAFEHQDFPFPRVVEALGLARDAGQNPLFQILFQAQTAGYRQQNALSVDLGVDGLEVTQELMPLSESKFDLGWHVMEREEGLSVVVEYRTGLFDAARIERMIGHFEQLLRSVVDAPERTLPALDYLPAEEKVALVASGFGEMRPLPPLAVHDAITQVAAAHADEIALICEGREWRYAELESAADVLARHLLEVPGLEQPGARIAVSMPGKAYSIIAFLAILKMGAIYVPIDPKNPADRIAYILEDAEATVVLTDDASLFSSHRCIDPSVFSGDAPEVALPPSNPMRLAYILYTSGSTGRPKGVPIDHIGLLNQLLSLTREPGIAAGDRMLALTTPAFDISILEMFWPLSVGATVVMYDQDLLLAPLRLADILGQQGITHLQATPASWRMLLDSGWAGRPGLIGLCGGEALDAQLAGRIVDRIGELWNVYGPTETTIWASALRVLPRHIASGKVPIGGLLDNTEFHILDTYLQLVPDGNPGELFIGGGGLSPGYWRRPSLAAEKFIPNPCGNGKAERLYRTGDLVIRRPSGEFEFIGRTDFQIKLRGYRIEIGEIESLLHEQAGVEQAIVVLDKPNERLVAYCLVDAQSSDTERGALRRELRRALAAKLPRYMVPAAFVLMDVFPLNTNGKVDRRKLPAPEAPTSVKTPLAPRSETEAALLAVWKQVLGRNDIGVDDNLFDLGGDSIAAIRIASGARARGMALSPGQLFEHQTVAAQALIVPVQDAGQEQPRADVDSDAPVMPAVPLPAGVDGEGVVDIFELHPAQAGMLLHTLMEPNSGVYFEQLWCRLTGALDVAAFRTAWQRVVERHDVLRAECHWIDLNRPVQIIRDRADAQWHIEDWRHLDATAQDAAFETWLEADRRRGFKMDETPLLRFALFRLGENEHRFVWSFHHLLMDGWCGAPLVREMLHVYSGGEPATLPVPYKRYLAWRTAQDIGAAESYWRDALAGLEGPTTIDLPATGQPQAETLELRATLAPELAERLRTLSRERRLTLATILQGAWALLLARYNDEDEVVFGAVQSGRPADLAGAEEMIGLFLNTVPVRVRAAGEERLESFLAGIQAGQADRERFGHIGLAAIQRCSGLGASTALFDTLVIVENYPLGILETVENASLRVHNAGSYERTNFPLTLRVFPGASLELSMSVDASRISAVAAHRLLGHYETLLAAFCRTPDFSLRVFDMLMAGERESLLALGRGPARVIPATVPAQIFARAETTPAAIAIDFAGDDHRQTLTYAELASRAGVLAAKLLGEGAGRGTVVAVWMERSPDLVVALLAVMASGAAYLPIDPDYPDQRIDAMLGDAGVSAIVVDAANAERAQGFKNAVVLQPDAEADLRSNVDLSAADSRDIAYLLYTSGSTGVPKGVPISHRNLANLITSMVETPGIGAGDRFLAVTTVGFDIAGLELFGPLVAGGTLLLTDAAATRDGARLAHLVESMDATVIQATPSGWRMLLASGWQGKADLKMLCGGEALESDVAENLIPRGAALWNMYGPTETTIWSAALKVEPALLNGNVVPIGGAIDNTHLLVLDRRGLPAPIGVAGELCIGGEGLSSGYWRRPEITARKFVANAFQGASYDQQVLYRTGDRVRWREDGHLEFLGRIDNQIKLRGHRIELGEIEAALKSHPGVAQALVHAVDDGAGARLLAYVIWEGREPGDATSRLRTHLQAALPAYMLPSAFISISAFPLTPNGKIDRKALPQPTSSKSDVELPVRLDEPATSLARIWGDALGIEQIAPKDNFFDMGGHSLLAVNVQRRIRQRFEIDLPVADLFRFPTLETLAAHVEAKLSGKLETVNLPDRGAALAAGRERLLQRRHKRPVQA